MMTFSFGVLERFSSDSAAAKELPSGTTISLRIIGGGSYSMRLPLFLLGAQLGSFIYVLAAAAEDDKTRNVSLQKGEEIGGSSVCR